MVSPAFSRSFLFLVAGVLAPVFLTQCKSTAKSYKDVSYDPAKLKTPAGHGLDRNDYPFDETGAYRKDWVKNNTSGRDRSATPQVEATTAVAAADTTPSTTPSSTSYPTYAEAAAARASGDFVGPAGATAGTATGTAATLASLPDTGSSASGVELASAGMTSSAPAPASAATSYHKVNSGDTLFALASKYNTSVPELKRVNGLSGDSIRSGQSLRIP